MTPLHSQVRDALKQLNQDEAVLFAMGCCQRAFPTFVGMHARGFDLEPPLALLDKAWHYLSENYSSAASWFPESFVTQADEKMEVILGSVEEPNEDENSAPSESCCKALSAILNHRQQDDLASLVHDCIWDAMDSHFGNLYGDMKYDSKEFDSWVENAPLFNYEWRCQLSDVEDIRKNGMSYSTIALIKNRAIRNRVAVNDARDPH